LDAAIEFAEEQVPEDCKDVSWYIYLINMYLLGDMIIQARAIAARADELASDSITLKFAWGMIFRAEGDLNRSNAVLMEVIDAAKTQLIDHTSLVKRYREDSLPEDSPLKDLGFDLSVIKFMALQAVSDNWNDLGNRFEAIRLLEESLAEDPNNPGAMYALARMKYYKSVDHPHLLGATKALASEPMPPSKRASLHYLLGEVSDACANYEQAFEHFTRANEALKSEICELIVEEHWQLIKDSIDVFDCELLSGMPDGETRQSDTDDNEMYNGRLIFIVGMPRSGSTLIEQILSCHPGVFAGGERHSIEKFFRQMTREFQFADRYPLWFRYLDKDDAKVICASYLDGYVRPLAGDRWFVDKTLTNHAHVGALSLLFPRARFIYCTRHPLDICLSCYFTQFQGIEYSHDLFCTARMLKACQTAMKHWKLLWPTRILEVEYEEMVTSSEATIRRIVEFCGLTWNDACLRFHERQRLVTTASSYQVKRPIYSTSVARWKNYEPFLTDIWEYLQKDGSE